MVRGVVCGGLGLRVVDFVVHHVVDKVATLGDLEVVVERGGLGLWVVIHHLPVVVVEVVVVVVVVVDPTFKALLVVSEVVFVAAWVFDVTAVVVGFFVFSSTPSYLLDRYFSNSDPSVSKTGVITTLYSS